MRFAKVVVKRRVGWGCGTGSQDVLWSYCVLCSGGWNMWIEEESDIKAKVEWNKGGD